MRDEVIASDCGCCPRASPRRSRPGLTHWNFPGAAVPRVVGTLLRAEDLDARAKREETVARMSGLRPTQRHVEEVYGGEWELAPRPPPKPISLMTPLCWRQAIDVQATRSTRLSTPSSVTSGSP